MRCVLQTMAQLHAHGVVWRDSKPENFLFLNDREDSPLKAVDFGTAVRCAPGEHITIRAGKRTNTTPFEARLFRKIVLLLVIVCALCE